MYEEEELDFKAGVEKHREKKKCHANILDVCGNYDMLQLNVSGWLKAAWKWISKGIICILKNKKCYYIDGMH